jgi:hypothetical protein
VNYTKFESFEYGRVATRLARPIALAREAVAVNLLGVLLWAAAVAVVCALISADWHAIYSYLKSNWPWHALEIGALAGVVLALLWGQRRRLPFTVSLSSAKLEIPGLGKFEVALTVAERHLLWRFFS